MLSSEDLRAALGRGLITRAQHRALSKLGTLRRVDPELDAMPASADDENFRFIHSFDDIFLSVGILLAIGGIVGVAVFASLWLAIEGVEAAALIYGVGAALMWLAAEIVAVRRRRTVPSMILAVAFVAFAARAVTPLLYSTVGLLQNAPTDAPPLLALFVTSATETVLLSAIVSLAAAAAFYVRFRLPFTLLLIAGLALVIAGTAVAAAASLPVMRLWWVILGIGIATFVVAMRYDARDPARTTRLADCAFWLHIAAAAMIVHGVLVPLLVGQAEMDAVAAASVIATLTVLGVVALVVDRRALLVSGLIYLGVAVGRLISLGAQALSPDALGLPTSLSLLVLGSGVIVMSLGWQPLRRLLVGGTALRRLVPLIPPPAERRPSHWRVLSDADLATAVDRGIITAAQRDALQTDARDEITGGAEAAAVDSENFRFIRSFHDVFLAVGIALLIGGILGTSAAAGPLAILLGMAILWALAEVIATRQRRTIPSMVLAAGFAGMTAMIVGPLLARVGLSNPAGAEPAFVAVLPFLSLAATGAAIGFYIRFRLPFALLLIAVGCFLSVFTIAHAAWSMTLGQLPWLGIGVGGVSFIAAMAYDARDPLRLTRLSDCGFWLHVAAAPMLVHGLTTALLGPAAGREPGDAGIIIAIFACLGLIALILDRRALLVSGLAYFGLAVSQLVALGAASMQDGASNFAGPLIHAGVTTSLTLLVLGGIVFAISLGWRRLRRLVVGRTGIERLMPFIPPVTP